MTKQGRKGRPTTYPNPQAEIKQDEDNISSQKLYKRISHKKQNYNDKLLCPFACPNCICLGGALVQSKYEIVNIISDTGDSIFSPMDEKYHDEHKSSIRNNGSSGKVFLSAELVDNFMKKFKK